jgi:hypothetical protein
VAQAQMKQVMSEMGLNNIERSYVYDDKGRVRGQLFRAGDVRVRNDHQLQRTRGCSWDGSN